MQEQKRQNVLEAGTEEYYNLKYGCAHYDSITVRSFYGEGNGVVMYVANFNKKLRFIVENGDLSTDGVLYCEYSDAFDEWYGDPIWYGDLKSYAGPVLEDYLIDPGYPESDFREWVASRLLNIGDEDPEISIEHLDKEIERIKNARKD